MNQDAFPIKTGDFLPWLVPGRGSFFFGGGLARGVSRLGFSGRGLQQHKLSWMQPRCVHIPGAQLVVVVVVGTCRIPELEYVVKNHS